MRAERPTSKVEVVFILPRGADAKVQLATTPSNISNGNLNFGIPLARMGPASGAKLFACSTGCMCGVVLTQRLMTRIMRLLSASHPGKRQS